MGSARNQLLTVGLLAALASGSLGAAASRQQQQPLPPGAFPGARGWGKNATGGRAKNARVLLVTSLADSGPGTLREALTASGPRVVVFRTGGVISLKSKISVRSGDLTVFGQTAPGDGVIVKNHPIRIGASNVIVRGLRVRNGDDPDGPAGDQRDSLQLGRVGPDGKLDPGGSIRDIVIDHCSFGWSMDETVEFWYGARNVTLSNNVFSEALWKSQHPYTVKGSPYGGNPGHGYAMLFGNGACDLVTVHHNLFAHNERRNPWIKDNARVELVNNVVYNWESEATGLWSPEPGAKPSSANILGNYYKPGPSTNKTGQGSRGVNLFKTAAPGSRFYLRGNVGPGRAGGDGGPEWAAAFVGTDFDASPFRADQPVPEVVSGISAQSAADAFEHVLKHAGAVPRDAADKRAVEDTRSGGGRPLDALSQIGGYPKYAPGTPPPDADADGLPDAWETARRLNPRDKTDATRFAPSGYLYVEEYANSLIPDGTPPSVR